MDSTATISPEKRPRPARPRRIHLRGWLATRRGGEIAIRYYSGGAALCIVLAAADAAALCEAVRNPRAPENVHVSGCILSRDDDGGYSLFAVGRGRGDGAEVHFLIPVTPAGARQLHATLSAALAQLPAPQQAAA